MMTTLKDFITQNPYTAYSYSYPHKNSYRPLSPALPLEQVWADEDRSSLFLYLHIPFCEMRCGFCNLFTLANPKDELSNSYLQALLTQIRLSADAIGDAGFARFAAGGGTPSLLSESQLRTLFEAIEQDFMLTLKDIPCSFETSPYTATRSKLEILSEYGIDRISIGVQSFLSQENRAIGRHQPETQLLQALDSIRQFDFSTINLDLIYGIPGQNETSWLFSLAKALSYYPEEIYLYPLYIRPQTGIGKKGVLSLAEHRKALYDTGRAYLLANGYEQVSMRMFRRTNLTIADAPVYCCQQDGMLGLGAGARSYTQSLHYSSQYAVSKAPTNDVINQYIQKQQQNNTMVNYGFYLNDDEKRRRYLILSLLSTDGLDTNEYLSRFKTKHTDDFPELSELNDLGYAILTDGILRLTDSGLHHSDSIGPWLYSQQVNRLVSECNVA